MAVRTTGQEGVSPLAGDLCRKHNNKRQNSWLKDLVAQYSNLSTFKALKLTPDGFNLKTKLKNR